jgi:NTE family protein
MIYQKKVGLALGSGGIKGLAHVGVIKTLLKHNVPIDFIAGSSIGAWVAAFFGLFQDIEKLEDYTLNKRRDKFYVFLEPTLQGGLIKGEKMEKLLNGWFMGKSFGDTKIKVAALATDLISGQSVVLNQGSLAKAVRASMSIPTLFKPVTYGDQLLIDGGSSNPVPDNVVREMGADIVISVNLDNYQQNRNLEIEDYTFKKIANRSLDIMRQHLAKYSLHNSDIVLEPFFPDIGFSSWRKYFQEEIGTDIVRIGEQAMEEKIDSVLKLLYTK